MSKKLYEEESILAIANAIRAQNGSTDTYKVADMAGAISDLSAGAESLAEFNQENSTVQSFIDNVTYTDDYSASEIWNYSETTDYRKDQPQGCAINVRSAGQLKLCDKNKALTADVGAGSYTLYNLTPDEICHYVNIIDGNIAQSGTVKPTGQVRMIKADSVNNIRDLGGWACDGGKVKYGLLFRGGELNGEHSVNISDDDKAVFKDLLGIRAELDLRGSYEVDMDTDDTSDDIASSALGTDTQYKRISALQYKDGVDLCKAYYSKMAEAVRFVFDCVKSGVPVYFHCVSGADRTGTLAAIIEAVLGVSQSDIDKDYELTFFTNEGSGAQRIRTDSNWVNFITYIKSMDGDTLSEKAASWLILAGFTVSEINGFRQLMIDGSPSALTNKVDYSCKGLSLNQTELTLNADDSATLTASLTPSWATGTVSWNTSNSSVVSVTASGNSATVTASASGSATVTASCNGYSASCTVTATAKEITYTAVINGISAGTKISSSDYVTETTGQVNYGASDYISASGYTYYRLSNAYDGLHTADIANEYLIFYDSSKNYLGKTDSVPNKAYASADTLTGALPDGTAYIRLRAYCSSTVEEQRNGFFSGSVAELGKYN